MPPSFLGPSAVAPSPVSVRIQRIAAQMKLGAVVAYPTEAVWGLGCDPFNKQAVYRLLKMKRRSVSKGVILVAADQTQFAPFLSGLSLHERSLLAESWPGPVTWLVPDNGHAPAWIRGDHQSVALRVSRHPTIVALCRAFGGPIVSTSANPQGKPPALNGVKVRCYFKGLREVIAPGVIGGRRKPSEIRDLITGKILRAD